MDLEIGKRYKVLKKSFNYRVGDRDYKGRLVVLTDELAIFDRGYYRTTEMLKEYQKLWSVKKL